METGNKNKQTSLEEHLQHLEGALNEDAEPEEKEYILNAVRELAQEARNITDLINNILEIRNNFKNEGLNIL